MLCLTSRALLSILLKGIFPVLFQGKTSVIPVQIAVTQILRHSFLHPHAQSLTAQTFNRLAQAHYIDIRLIEYQRIDIVADALFRQAFQLFSIDGKSDRIGFLS